jgi:hypothetical protein
MPLTTVPNSMLTSDPSNASNLTSGSISAARMPTGSVIQVVSAYSNTSISMSSGTYASTGFSISITPRATTSKIWVQFSGGNIDNISTNNQPQLTIYRGSTNVSPYGVSYNMMDIYAPNRIIVPVSISYLDSPATTSSTTYTLYWRNQNGASQINMNTTDATLSMIAMEIQG